MAGFTEGVVMNSCPDDDRSQCDNSSEMTFVRLLSPRVNDVPTSEYDHAAHCMIYCRTNKAWFGNTIKANIMMQFRFDGCIGFPGGAVEANETIVMGLNRELQEEIALNLDKYSIKDSDHLVSHIYKERNFVLHFFIKSVTEEDFNEIQAAGLTSEFYGTEVMGTVIPPLFTMSNGISGLPNFLANMFIGNAKQQLLYALESCEILSKTEINEAVMKSKIIKKQNV
ncbi:U8 snoRNA-decapping enzyme-like [Octopus sinensis]|uniref:U8 snoRNA-decapping enzyme n=1 Tax=Octopus sinensis TaxID=2607531 RepID=A0A6P7T0I5_9MOLL|nr:U8 snoRNA-decapping enzyme-like [Octopus sinensis]XP_036361759.1 U8 snoRNA-decapping enzyme-like [Octopus sinensis]XP_036361760.1 U8 snoRNA-decapping enzyme-like [Octopus sinensis]XP_036361765.1 U8 snoRNA-decapping enzyme-like [Octopus sinensis]